MNKQSAIGNQPSALERFFLYVNDMALCRLSTDEMVDYLNFKEKAAAELARLQRMEAAARGIKGHAAPCGYYLHSDVDHVCTCGRDALTAALNESETK